MTSSTSRLAYADCYEIFDRALEDPRGIRVRCASTDKANYLRMRCHNARAIDRDTNRRIYAEQQDHPLYCHSTYDGLILRIKDISGTSWLYIEQAGAEIGEIEALSKIVAVAEEITEADRKVPELEHILDHVQPEPSFRRRV